mgnify:CR=1 FL=1|jgi:sugar-specific transcriptional regulator TrmB
MPQTELMQLGFPEGEAELYTTLIKLGRASASELSQKTGRHRTHIYDTIEKLKDKGLVSESLINGKKVFSPANPNNLISYFNEKKERAEELVNELKVNQVEDSNQVIVETFTGKRGVKSVLIDMLDEKKDFLGYGYGPQFSQNFPIFYQKYRNIIIQNKIKTRIILKDISAVLPRPGLELRTLNYLSPTATYIYGNKIALIIWEPFPTVIRITNKMIADSHRSYFEVMWKKAKKV